MMSDTTLPTDDEHDEYVGWTIVSVGQEHSLLLQSPTGARRGVLFRVHEVQRLEEEIERLRAENEKLREEDRVHQFVLEGSHWTGNEWSPWKEVAVGSRKELRTRATAECNRRAYNWKARIIRLYELI